MMLKTCQMMMTCMMITHISAAATATLKAIAGVLQKVLPGRLAECHLTEISAGLAMAITSDSIHQTSMMYAALYCCVYKSFDLLTIGSKLTAGLAVP